MKEKRREPEVPEEEVPVVERLDGLARITSKELAPIHSVKSDTLQNACSTSPKSGCRFGEKCSYAHRQASPRMVADLVKSALMHIARLMNSLAKGPKRMMTKVK